MTGYDPRVAQQPLTGFQRATVRHVAKRFYQDDVRRFLVADETGLGKSMVARGVIAEAITALQHDDRVQRIDVVYVCSNLDIARQNTSRLLAGEGNVQSITSRLTLLAKHSRSLNHATTTTGKPVNLVAFTPGTSFEHGSRAGRVDERALLFILLAAQHDLSGWSRRAAMTLLQGGVARRETFHTAIRDLRRDLHDEPDPIIAKEFAERCADGLDGDFQRLIEEIGRQPSVPDGLRNDQTVLIGELRNALAKASITTLEPDLVILDEFQRFRHLMSDQDEGAAELARELFDYRQARVLLLSATPYKPYTVADESIDGENHHRDFFELLGFLNSDQRWLGEVRRQFDTYRDALVAGAHAGDIARSLRTLLLEVMCRTERPPLGHDENDMVTEIVTETTSSADDIVGYATLRKLAQELNGSVPIDYWKSVPYFVNFMEGYQLGDKLREAWKDKARRESLLPVVRATQRLLRSDVQGFRELDTNNGRLRALLDTTVRSGQARMLWLPPSLPYHALGEPFASARRFTKRLVFSSWTATPTAVAALLSYEIERQLMNNDTMTENTPDARHRMATRLAYRVDGDRPAAMTTLALFWPNPGLAAVTDPLTFARRQPHTELSSEAIAALATDRITTELPQWLVDAEHVGESNIVDAYLRWPGSTPDAVRHADAVNAMAAATSDDERTSGLRRHVDAALGLLNTVGSAARHADELAAGVAALGMYAPANIAWRALARLAAGSPLVTPSGHWLASARLAAGLRTLFRRNESIALLDRLYPDDPYWHKVLQYCAAGDLQSTMDEYLQHLCAHETGSTVDDDSLSQVADTALAALTLRAPTYHAFDPDDPADQRIGFTSRFALRYASQATGVDSARPTEIREAFNSPFWPFVLATTSAGQEGIDFHWWSHAVVHWNVPTNPVDFEQREGRVHRYGGHAIRKNIAARHRDAILAADDPQPWRAAFRIAGEHADHLGDFAPYWLYPGDAKIERHLLPYALSQDIPKSERLKRGLALYRLAFGQPRQEDFLAMVDRHGTALHQPMIDLRPPM